LEIVHINLEIELSDEIVQQNCHWFWNLYLLSKVW